VGKPFKTLKFGFLKFWFKKTIKKLFLNPVLQPCTQVGLCLLSLAQVVEWS